MWSWVKKNIQVFYFSSILTDILEISFVSIGWLLCQISNPDYDFLEKNSVGELTVCYILENETDDFLRVPYFGRNGHENVAVVKSRAKMVSCGSSIKI